MNLLLLWVVIIFLISLIVGLDKLEDIVKAIAPESFLISNQLIKIDDNLNIDIKSSSNDGNSHKVC